MNTDLQNKKALITGSTAGIGFGIACGLARERAQVILNGRSPSGVSKAVGQLRSTFPGAQVEGIAADLASPSGLKEIAKRVGHVDILVNNVGTFEAKDFLDITDRDWQEVLDVNLMTGVRLSRMYLAKMLEAGWGRIIFISSESGIQTPGQMIHYGVSKTAQLALARGLSTMTAGSGVTVNSVLPGPTMSEGARQFLSGLATRQQLPVKQVEQEFIEKTYPASLLKRFATVEEVANLVTYLSSPLSAATNGAALRVDGGVIPTIL